MQVDFCDTSWMKALFSNTLALDQARNRLAFRNCQRTVTKMGIIKTKQQQKNPQFIYLLVLPKLKISSPTAKEKKTNKQNKIQDPPSSFKVTEHRMNCSGTGGCREPGGGGWQDKLPKYLKSCPTETVINIGQCETSKNKEQQ